jgi:hypothetical protein
MTLFHEVSFLPERGGMGPFDITVFHVLPAAGRFSRKLITRDRSGSVAYVSFLE